MYAYICIYIYKDVFGRGPSRQPAGRTAGGRRVGGAQWAGGQRPAGGGRAILDTEQVIKYDEMLTTIQPALVLACFWFLEFALCSNTAVRVLPLHIRLQHEAKLVTT